MPNTTTFPKLSEAQKRRFSREKCPAWRGGITPINTIIRHSLEFKEWRKKIFERDNYTCQDCGAKSRIERVIYLHPHHIKSFAFFPELRFDVNNGLTLCEDCHKRTDNYANGAKIQQTTHTSLKTVI